VDPRLLVGAETLDDAAALKVSDDLGILFTADFITPLVDDPRAWGRIAAANSLSDIYAMGGRPLAALNLVCWPADLPSEMLLEVLEGGAAVAAEAECLIVGGHTIDDREPKYGMAVVGLVQPDAIVRNRGAECGNRLYLTKPLGTGVLSTAIKADFAEPDQIAAAATSMSTLNRSAAEAAVAARVRAMTDVTGFGLVGHLAEMLGDSGDLGVEVSLASLPLFPGVDQQMAMGMIPRGAYRNRDAFGARVRGEGGLDAARELILFDPQTSGGLLIAIAADDVAMFERQSKSAGTNLWPIGQFDSSGHVRIVP
jgi:selenide,water dikinase